MSRCTLHQGDSLEILRTLEAESIHCCVTSPPYLWLRDYGPEGQIGLEATPEAYVERMVEVFREVRRVLRKDGTCWINIGDTYCTSGKGGAGPAQSICSNMRDLPKRHPGHEDHSATGLKPKDLIGVPWLLALALRRDGWYLRSEIIWHKSNAMPESVIDRPTKAHETIFFLTKSPRYYYDQEAIREPVQVSTRERYRNPVRGVEAKQPHDPRVSRVRDRTREKAEQQLQRGRNKRSVWTCAVSGYRGAHFATYPPELITPCVLSGCPENGIVLDPFSGTGTTGEVALRYGRSYVGIELNPQYIELSRRRLGLR